MESGKAMAFELGLKGKEALANEKEVRGIPRSRNIMWKGSEF